MHFYEHLVSTCTTILHRKYIGNFVRPLLPSLRGSIEVLFILTIVALKGLHVDM